MGSIGHESYVFDFQVVVTIRNILKPKFPHYL